MTSCRLVELEVWSHRSKMPLMVVELDGGALTAGRLLRMEPSLTPLGLPFAFGIRVAGVGSTGASGSASFTGASTDTY